jgi:hypothetical protein
MSPNLFAEFVEEFDDGEGLLWNSIGGNVEGDAQLVSGRAVCRFQVFVLRRCLVRCSARSVASLSR